MRIAEIGGEFALIKRVTGACRNPAVVQGIGDDCAVLEYTADRYMLVTVDMMVENDHFTLGWHSPSQVGSKLMESNVSDILAMGGVPRWAFVSLSLKPDLDVEFVEELYRGMFRSAERHGVALIGGDTTHGRDMTLSLTLIGDVEKSQVRLRSHALPGDLLCVTGTLGKSEAGLRLLKRGRRDGYVQGHLEPRCRTVEEAGAIARHAHAMIDVSDGLGSETRHICEESRTGARIDWDKIPISLETGEAALSIGCDPCEYALYGGEDFELVFTVAPKKLADLQESFSDFTVVGEILPAEKGLFLTRDGARLEVKGGFDHFASGGA
jgi:thiamine-monophosphate kinase